MKVCIFEITSLVAMVSPEEGKQNHKKINIFLSGKISKLVHFAHIEIDVTVNKIIPHIC
jgi:hypothetical protein